MDGAVQAAEGAVDLVAVRIIIISNMGTNKHENKHLKMRTNTQTFLS